jgi:hypothetical protein
VYNAVGLKLLKHLIDQRRIGDRPLHNLQAGLRRQVSALAGAEIVDYQYLITPPEEAFCQVGSDESGSSGN